VTIPNTPNGTPSEGVEPAPPSVSVVFLAYNRREALRESLDRMLVHSGYPADRLEVIVVDNASSDGTADMVRSDYPSVRLIVNDSNLGAPGWNPGFRQASGDFVVILDDDAYLPPGALERMTAAAGREGADLVSVNVVSSFEPDRHLNDDWRTGLLSFWGCAALVSRRAMHVLGGYDPHMFIWANEVEFTMRLLDEGFTHLFLPDVEAVHCKERIVTFEPRRYRVNARHHAYIAGRLMRGRDGGVVVRNLIANAIIDTAVEDRSALGAIPLVLRGFADGLRRRRPARAEVSAAYRENFAPFAPAWRFMRTPAERRRARRGLAGADEQRHERREAWFAARERFYPVARGRLRL
jgi:GT2 family glycosyltransferase